MRKLLKWILRVMVWSSFAVYIWALYNLLYMGYSREAGRGIPRWKYISENLKLIPFETIGMYIHAIKYKTINLSIPVSNLLGNFILLLPLGFYLPLFFQKLKRFGLYAAAVGGIIFFIESTQLILMRGTFDVDDFILNMLGAILGFLCWKLKSTRRLEKLYREAT